MPPRLTTLALQAAAAQLRPGDLAVDATVGNGHDTLALARAVSPGGRVAGFDIQPAALGRAARRLQENGLADTVDLHACGHEDMATRLPRSWRGQVRMIMFNLGYLPASDSPIVTGADTTRTALDAALTLLADDGLISVLLYRNHPGADAETLAVTSWLSRRSDELLIEEHDSPGPVWYCLRPRADRAGS